jgi:hypothetical protein
MLAPAITKKAKANTNLSWFHLELIHLDQEKAIH